MPGRFALPVPAACVLAIFGLLCYTFSQYLAKCAHAMRCKTRAGPGT